MSVRCWLYNGNELKQLDLGQVDSLDASTALIPGGAYTTFRTFQGTKTLLLEDHFLRLEETSHLAGQPVQIERLAVRGALRRVLAEAQRLFAVDSAPDAQEETPTQPGIPSSTPFDLRLRMTLDLEQRPGELYLAAEPLHTPPQEAYAHGVRVVIRRMQRINPKAKLTRFIQRSDPVRQSLPAGVNEAVMVNEQDELLEGLSSNFYAILYGEIWTAEAGVLSGITRSMVIECARRLDIPMRYQPARLSDVPRIQEAFITSASRAVLPLCQIEDTTLPQTPGALTRRLMQAYVGLLEERLEKI